MAWATLSPNTGIQSGTVADAWLSKERETTLEKLRNGVVVFQIKAKER
jgi:hypothetical protein